MFDLQNYPRMIEILKTAHDTTGGAAVRELLWSLYNNKQLCNLWESIGDLGMYERAELTQLILMDGDRRAKVLEALLRETGELPATGWEGGRIDEVPLRTMARLIEEGRAK